jgi:hypothetical protein
MNNPSLLAKYGPGLLLANINSPQAQAAGITPPYPGFQGDVAQALRPWPQYTRLNAKSVPTGYSTYNSFTAKLEKRFTGGLIGRVAYTVSKLINSGADDVLVGDSPGIQNPLLGSQDRRSLSRDDLPRSLILAWSYELPFGKGKKFAGNANRTSDAFIGGWTMAATQRYDAGRPLSITMACDFCSVLFSNTKRPNKVGDGYSHTSNVLAPGGYLNLSGWADPGSYAFGNAPLHDGSVRSFPYYNEDLNIAKRFRVTERVGMRFESQFGNLFNRHLWCDPDTNWSSPTFGEVFGQCDQPRNIQFGLRLEF